MEPLIQSPREVFISLAALRSTNWSFTKESPVQVELDATQLNVEDITKLVQFFPLPLDGEHWQQIFTSMELN